MITLARVGDVVRFTFQDNPLYLNNGTIEVPVNSLSLLIDESNIATFKKAASNDIFLSCSLDELGMTRTQLINWYKDNMVDEGITPEEVEDIVESATTNLFGYAEYDSQNTRINFKHDASGSVISSIDASDFVIDGMIDNVEIVTVEGVKYLKITFNTESGKEPILIPLADIFNPDNYYTKTATDALLAEKANTATTYTKTEVDNAISAATSGKADTTAVTQAISAATSGKADTSAVTDAIDAIDAAYKAADAVISGAVDSVSGDVATESQRAISAETALDSKIDTVSGNVVTSGEIESMIEEAVSGKADTSAVTEAISAATSGKADADDVYTKTEVDNAISAATSGKVDTTVFDEKERVISAALNDLNTRKLDASAYTPTDLSNYYTKSETDGVIEEAVSGKADTSAVTEAISAAVSGKADSNNVYTKTEANALLADKADTATTYTKTEVDSALSGKADTSAVTEAISAAVSGKADTATTYTKTEVDNAITAATSTKQDTLVSGTNIKTINNESILGSGNIDIQGGGGKAVSAGTNISITTGETADTINCTLPITAGTGTNSIIFGDSKNVANGVCAFAGGTTYSFLKNEASKEASFAFGRCCKATGSYSHAEGYITKASGQSSHAEGDNTEAQGSCSHAEGYKTSATTEESHAEGFLTTASGRYSHAEGSYTKTSNQSEHASGQYNNSVSASTTFGDSGNTLFSVGNGTADNARHNAFEIRQNGDIYLTKDGQDVKLQDQLGGGGSSYTAGDGIDITNDVISVTGKVDTSAITTSMTSGSTDSQVPSAKAVYDNFGGLKLVKLTQAEYDALVTKDSDTLYVVTDN